MSRAFARIVILLLAAGGVCGLLASAAPLQLVGAIHQPTVAVAGAGRDVAVDPTDLRPRFRPNPASTPAPAPLPHASPTLQVTPPRRVLAAIAPPEIQATEVALVNLDTGRFMWQSNSHMPWAPASLTKIFTAMVAVDLMGLNRVVTVPPSIRSLPWDATVMGLTPGEQLTVRDLMYGIFLLSGNDAAETLAAGVTTRTSFVADMNAMAARLGLQSTHFVNPTGLDAPGHYSSAYDLAIASMYLESHYGSLVSIAATPKIDIPATATHKAYNLVSLDKLLWRYPGVYGLKTGWTGNAGGCLITTAYRGGHRILAVILGAPPGTANEQMPKILDYGFELLGVLPRPAPS